MRSKKERWKRICLRCNKVFYAVSRQQKICSSCWQNYDSYKSFEAECYDFLKNKFTNVKWLSEKDNSVPYDFSIEKDGKTLQGDAKFTVHHKVVLNPKQSEADFILRMIEGKVVLIFRKDFYMHVNFSKSRLIKISQETKDKIDTLKKPGVSYNLFIERLLE